MTPTAGTAPQLQERSLPVLRRAALVLAPIAVIATMFPAFQWYHAVFGSDGGDLAGYVSYWIIWCWLFPRWVMQPCSLRDLFRAPHPRFGRPAWFGLVLLLIWPLIAVAITPPQAFAQATLPTVVLAAVLGFVNGTAEEILWRGLFTWAFPGRMVLGYVYPAIGFALFHFIPVQGLPSQAMGSKVVAALFIGLMWGWVVQQTGSIRWSVAVHTLVNFIQQVGRAG